MKRIISYVSALIIAAALSAGCADKADGLAAGEGKLRFEVKFDGAAPATRAGEAQDCVIRISNAQGTLYQFSGTDEIPSEIALLSGNYTLTAEAGTRENSGFETPFVYFYKGSEQFTVSKGETVSVSLVCPVLNNIFTAAFDEALVSELTDYSFTLHTDGDDPLYTIVFDASNAGEEACVMFANGQTTVDWTFEAKHNIKGTVTKTGTLEGLAQGKRYDLTVSHTIRKGNLELTVTAEESAPNEQGVSIYQKPVITAVGFDMDELQDKNGSYKITAAGSSEISSIVLSGSVFGAGYDLLAAESDPAEYGVEIDTSVPEKVDVTFTPSLFAMITGMIGEISIEATDSNNNKISAVFSVIVADLGIENVRRVDIWATHATVKGVAIESVGTMEFAYRAAGSSDWTFVPAEMYEQYKYSTKITGLDPAANYEAALFVDGILTGSIVTFTTEEARQPENAGFEDWSTSGSTISPYLNTSNRFWDTANSGLSSANNSTHRNPTRYIDDDFRPGSSGTRSAKMNSYYVTVLIVSKFAAGNIYTGDFGKVEILKGGASVNFGKPFTSRPTHLKGWYKGFAGTINYAGSGSPVAKNDPDEFQIYACLTTWTKQHTVETWNSSSFMNFNSPDIIAFGEISGQGSVPDWTEFDIPLKYRNTEAIPTYILIVATSSKYGDYFTGSTSSWLQIDDFELVYDDNVVLQD